MNGCASTGMVWPGHRSMKVPCWSIMDAKFNLWTSGSASACMNQKTVPDFEHGSAELW